MILPHGKAARIISATETSASACASMALVICQTLPKQPVLDYPYQMVLSWLMIQSIRP